MSGAHTTAVLGAAIHEERRGLDERGIAAGVAGIQRELWHRDLGEG